MKRFKDLPLGLKLQIARKQSFLSQEELAAAAGITAPTLSKWENNKTPQTMQMFKSLLAIMVELNLRPEDIVEGGDVNAIT